MLTAGCDTPIIPASLVERLLSVPAGAHLADLPVIGFWPASLAEGLDRFLAADRKHAVRAWAAEAGVEAVDWGELPNVNEPADLAGLKLV